MGKHKLAPALFLSLFGLLVACSSETTSSSSAPSSSEGEEELPDIDPKNDYAADDSRDGLIDTLLKMKEEQNFTVTSDYDKSVLSFNKKFFINKKQNVTYVNLPSHKDETKNLAYSVKYTKNNDPYPAAMGYSEDAYGNRSELSFDDFNFLHSIKDDLKVTAFINKDNSYVTEDEGVISSLNEFYGTSSIGKASFWFDSGNTVLNYEIFDASNVSLTTGSFSHISNTRNKKLETLADSFSWEKEGKALTQSQASTLFDENFSCSTDIKRIGALEGTLRIATIDFSCDKDNIYIHSVDDPDGTPKDYYTYLTRRDDGRAISHGLNAQNEKTEEETRYFFEQWPVPKDLDINDFRLCADGNYRYFSLEPNLVYQSLAHVSVNDNSCSFEEAILKMENDKVVGVTMNSPANLLYRYQAVTTLQNYKKIEMPSSYGEDGPREISHAMTYFDGTSPFKIVKANRENIEDATRKTIYTFDGTTYLIQEESYNSTKKNWENNVYGYTKKDDGSVVAFRQIKGTDRLVQSEDIVADDKITNYFSHTIAPSSVKSVGNGEFMFRELITECKGSLWISDNVIPSTVKMNVLGGKIVAISYGVNYSTDDGEYLTFGYEDVSIPAEINVNKIGPMELTSYQDDTPDEWSDLVNYIGEENALLIPYYYDKKYVGNWYAENCYSSGTGVPDNGGDYDDTPLIGVSLYLFGSSTPTSVLDNGFESNGFTRLNSGKIDVGYRDDDYIANGRDSDVYLVDTSTQTVWEKNLSDGGKLRVIYDSGVAYFHFNPSHPANYTLDNGLLIQLFDKDGNLTINRNGEFH